VRLKHGNNYTWATGQAAGLPPSAGMTATAPARPAAFGADLFVPIGQALVTGLLIGGLVAFLVARILPGWGGVLDLWLGLGLAIAAGVWVLLLRESRALLWQSEKILGVDLNGDGAKGPPAERVIIANAAAGQREAAQREAAGNASGFARFVGALAVKGTAERTWEPILTRPVYQQYRDVLIRLGWAKWKSIDRDGRPNETKGWKLTQDPAEIIKRISG
jgi:hypothetical protein